MNFAFLESYFSNLIEGTEFEIDEAKGFVLEGKQITERLKDSHDTLGILRQALGSGESVLMQLIVRHEDQRKSALKSDQAPSRRSRVS